MGVLKVIERSPGRSGGAFLGGRREMRRVFRVQLETVDDDPIQCLNAVDPGTGRAVPGLGDSHPNVTYAVLTSLTWSSITDKDGLVYEVVATYSTDVSTGALNRNPTQPTSPLNDTALVSIGTRYVSRLATVTWEKKENGDALVLPSGSVPTGTLPVNSAGEHFDPPPSEDYPHWLVTVVKNYATFDWATYGAAKGAINSAQFTLAGLTIPAYFARCEDISTPGQTTRNGVDYYPVTFVFDVIPTTSVVEPYGHVWKSLDCGWRYWNGSAWVRYSRGQVFTERRMDGWLNNAGNVSSSRMYLRINVHDVFDFSTLSLPTAIP